MTTQRSRGGSGWVILKVKLLPTTERDRERERMREERESVLVCVHVCVSTERMFVHR